MSFIRVTYLEPCRVASFHVTDSLTPEEEAHSLFLGWAERKGLLPEHRFIPLIGFNNPWGPVGEKRGYELWCVLDNLGDIDLHDTIVKEFSGGLYVVITIPGLDRIMQGRELANKWLKDHPKYETNYAESYRHCIDPSLEYEVVYTPTAEKPEDFILDYYIPIKEKS
jgi:DNA gyrase inhibitor GyrI